MPRDTLPVKPCRSRCAHGHHLQSIAVADSRAVSASDLVTLLASGAPVTLGPELFSGDAKHADGQD
jgi:hypothetical protein